LLTFSVGIVPIVFPLAKRISWAFDIGGFRLWRYKSKYNFLEHLIPETKRDFEIL
jgi:hypothetical protein